MRKYNVMLIDAACERIVTASCINWKALGLEVIAETDSISQEIIENVNPDIILIAAQYLPETLPSHAKLIVMSNSNADAVRALRLSAAGYIIKPVQAQELIDALTQARRLLDRDFEQKKIMRDLKNKHEELEIIQYKKFLDALIWGGVSEREIESMRQTYKLPILDLAHKAAIVFEIDPHETSVRYKPASVERIIIKKLSKHCAVSVLTGSLEFIAITAWEAIESTDTLIELISKICSECESVLETRLTAGIGRYYKSAALIYESFSEAKLALKYNESATVVNIEDVHINRAGASPDICRSERIFSAVKFGSPEQITMHIRDLTNRLSTLENWRRQACMLDLLSEVYKTVERYELYNEPQVMEILEKYICAPDFDLTQWLMELFLYMSEHIRSSRERTSHNISEDARHYIDLHYHESGLSVDRLCEYLHVSQSYFSTVFKHETGMSFVSYLTELRMSRAVSLLQQTDDKAYVIASKVGYDDANYFSYVFKRRFGVSPGRYRKISREL